MRKPTPSPAQPEPFDPACRRCARLADHLGRVAADHPGYHCAPVPTWGDSRARLLIVGLAPGMHGANRTGRPFTGDASGKTLFAALAQAGLADVGATGVQLRGCRITNAVRCLPPGNRPTPEEVRKCRGYLRFDLDRLWWPGVRRPRCVVALGVVAYQAVTATLGMSTTPRFEHGLFVEPARRLGLMASFHPSRQNVNTGRLNEAMLLEIFDEAVAYLEGRSGLSGHPGEL